MGKPRATVELNRDDIMDLVAIVERVLADGQAANDAGVWAAVRLDAHEDVVMDRVRRALR